MKVYAVHPQTCYRTEHEARQLGVLTRLFPVGHVPVWASGEGAAVPVLVRADIA